MNLFLILLAVAIIGAVFLRSSKKSNPNPDKSTNEDLPFHETARQDLTNAQIERIRIIQKALIEVNDTSIEKTIENFRKDMNPEGEIKIWEAIAGTYQHALSQNPDLTFNQRDEIYKLLLLRSMMPSEEVMGQFNLTALSKSEALKVLDSYNLEHKPILVVG